MNFKPLFGSLVALAAVTSAFADDITVDPHAFTPMRTRAEVTAELAQFKQSGVNPWATSYNPLREFQFTKTRAEVQQEAVAAREEVRALTGEDSGSAFLAQRRTSTVGTQLAGASM